MTWYATILQMLGTLSIVAIVAGTVLLAMVLTGPGRALLRDRIGVSARGWIGLGAVVASVATLGSLYLSEVAGLAPCTLCWYQRIAMYPMVFVLGLGWMFRDADVARVTLPLPVLGLATSIYHVVIQLRPHLDVVSCSSEVPCTARYVAVFGWISIPVMAGAAFLLVTAALVASRSAAATR